MPGETRNLKTSVLCQDFCGVYNDDVITFASLHARAFQKLHSYILNEVIMAIVCCSLCLESIPGDNHRNKKKLHGQGAAAKAKATLCDLLPVPLESLDSLQDPRAVLCSRCEKTLIDIRKLEQKLAVLKMEIGEHIHRLRVATPHEATTSATLPGCSAALFHTPCTTHTTADMAVEPLQFSCAPSQELSPQVEVRVS